MSDLLHRFIFDTHGIRGEAVELKDTVERVLKGHDYPNVIANLLQQAAAVNLLLATTLKFEGKISLQLQTNSKLKMLVVQTTHKLGYRGLARYDKSADFSNDSFTDLVSGGHLSITIEPLKGKRYQGIVPLDGENLAECIENYFNQSEQLKTRIWLFNNESQVFGLFLQALPDMLSEDSFDHLVYLASTLKEEECLSVSSDIILHRLFHQESIRGMTTDQVKFTCGCSEKKMLDSLSLLPEEEITEIIESKGEVAVKCEFCLNQFSFSEVDIKTHHGVKGNQTRH
ncbi:redox-regulated molecular chaperone Hsp33 [Aliikangiella marina]|uniref:Redox-regulated molecular chaperone Hsp33 n=1 Tax=Aliikangiella marina TaxID=1712262 RepID=A0A545T9L8_9GAMM|nr:Hsp33 family molecular chaperone HslO [Aliikangiella marina]TQV73913.1 redox-regulated molecular chaperone Hsp33 [Aliikangiella marina]